MFRHSKNDLIASIDCV